MAFILESNMVYFTLDSGAIKFPKVQEGQPYGIKFTNQTTKQTIYKTDIAFTGSNTFYEVEFSKNDFIPGQYDYRIYSEGTELPYKEGKTLSQGICQFDNFEPSKEEYSNDLNIMVYG